MLKQLPTARFLGLALSGVLLFSSCQKNVDSNEVATSLSDDLAKKGDNRGKDNGTVFYALTDNNQLVKYSTDKPFSEMGAVGLTGLPTGEKILAIDFRPATGQLYGVSSASRIYTINQNNGRTNVIGTAPFTPAINGNLVGFDFNPTVDRIRLVTDNEQSLRINPETGATVAVDGNINPGNPALNSVAYRNSFAGATTTELYAIDVASDNLFTINPPNAGTLVLDGPLGIDAKGEGGFDISPDNSLALAALFAKGNDDDDDNDEQDKNNGFKYRFYSINLETGKAKNLGKTDRVITGVAIPTNPVAYSVNESNGLVVFNPETGVSFTRNITGLQAGEKLVGIDFRPANGQLYGLGSSSRIYTIYTAAAMGTASATMVGAMAFTPALSGTSFGFDFNPVVDRIRIVSNTGQNLRAHPATGVIAFTDGSLNPGSPMVDAVAYTNNFAGTTTTELYAVDFGNDNLYTITPPNNGTLALDGGLGKNVEAHNGFDIGGTSNEAYGIFTVGGTTGLYKINLDTGAATFKRTISGRMNGFALGLGF